MRIWHKYLIDCLPRKQLLVQWRNCCAIAKEISETKNVKGQAHEIMNYPLSHFRAYAMLVANECGKRGYKVQVNCFWRYFPEMSPILLVLPNHSERIWPEWHNNLYLVECFSELLRKRRTGQISKEEWAKLDKEFGGIIEIEADRRVALTGN